MYADLLAARIKGHHRMKREDVAHVLSPRVAAPAGEHAARGATRDSARSASSSGAAALDLALAVGVAALFGWGVVFSRREGHGLAGIIAAASVNAAVGLVIIGLKVAVR